MGEWFTARLAEEIVTFSAASDAMSKDWGRHALLDWLGVTLAGSQEQSAQIMTSYVVAESGGSSGRAAILGTPYKVPARQAVLANGIAAHALDYDDSNQFVGGHPSAPIVTAAVALAQRDDRTLEDILEAVTCGFHAQALVFGAVGRTGYDLGFHSTGTLGTFGSTAACGWLLGLDPAQMTSALGLAATQAAGLKASFGTMGKHLNAAKAAANGLLAVELAKQGFTGATEAIGASQGFASTHGGTFAPDAAFTRVDGVSAITRTDFKRHSCCHGTHSAIETAEKLRSALSFAVDDIERVTLLVPLRTPEVCGIPEPRTGLEGKFSVRYATALALAGRSTGPSSFTDEAVNDPIIVALRDRIDVIPTSDIGFGDPARLTLRLISGESHSAAEHYGSADGGTLATQWERLAVKFRELASPVVGVDVAAAVVQRLAQSHSSSSVSALIDLTRAA